MYYYLISLYWFTCDDGTKEQRCESVALVGTNKRKADILCSNKNKKAPEGSTYTYKVECSEIVPNNHPDKWVAYENVYKSLGRDVTMQRIK